jgi:hypothetical protein
MVVKIEVMVFWVVAPYSVVIRYQCFGELCFRVEVYGKQKMNMYI